MNFLGISFKKSNSNDVMGFDNPPNCPSCHSSCKDTCDGTCDAFCSNTCEQRCGHVARWW